jgi:flavin-dependent dehydrogenase
MPVESAHMGSHEVAVIGAGPAGSAAARLLAAWGHDVVLIHRHEATRRTLAESIPPSCRKLLAAIGVLERIDAAGFLRSSGNTVWWGTSEPRVELFRDGEGYQVERGAFADLMRASAIDAGTELIETTARDVTPMRGSARIALASEPGGPGELEARFVLDCSGRAGVIARRGWREEVAAQPRTVALVASWRRAGGWPGVEPTHTVVESYGDGWAWSVPLDGEVRYVTAMVDPQRTELARGRPPLDVYRGELNKAPHLCAAVAHAQLERGPWGCDASTYRARTAARDPVLLVGDAASFIDPLSSFGIKKAMASAWLAAVAVHTSLRRPSMTEAALEFFAAREAEMAAALIEQTRAHFAQGAAAHASAFWADRAASLDLPSTKEPDVRVLRDDPRVQRAFAALKAQPAVAFRRGAALRVEPRPVIRGNEIVLEDRLFTPDLREGVRFLRDVDACGLLALAAAHHDVPALFESYNKRHPPVALPDFLGAISVMRAFGVLDDRNENEK